MVKEESIPELEKKLRIAWKKKLEKEGFKPTISGSVDGLVKEVEKQLNDEYKPIEIRLIREAVFEPRFIPYSTYTIYIRK